MSKVGVDISTYQKKVNYNEAVKHIEFAIIRVGYGVQYYPQEQRDTEFDNHYNGLKGKIPLGAYYYAYGTDYNTGVKEAENCLAYTGDKKFEMPIYYDMEENRNTKEAGQGFVDRIRQAGLKAGIYASSSFYKNKGLANINCDSVWIAEYGSNNGNIPKDKPKVNYNIWQYTSKGQVQGIGSNIDMNIIEEEIPNVPVKGYTFKDFVKEVQKAIGAKVDGIPGPETLSKTITVSRYKNYKHAVIKPIQKYLYSIGYKDIGEADGVAGPKFEKAVKQYQINNGCYADGEITARQKTWRKILKLI